MIFPGIVLLILMISPGLQAPRQTAEALLGEASAVARAGRSEEAIRKLEDLTGRYPQLADAHSLLGMLYRQTGRVREANESFRRVVELEPSSPQAHNNLGASYLELGQTEAATKAFRRSLELAPNDLNALYNLGVILSQAGNTAEAHALLARARRLSPGSFDIAFELARTAVALQQYKLARAALEAVPPGSVPQGAAGLAFLKLLASSQLKLNDCSAARPVLLKITALSPDDAPGLLGLIECHLKANQTEDAMRYIPALQKSARSSPRVLVSAVETSLEWKQPAFARRLLGSLEATPLPEETSIVLWQETGTLFTRHTLYSDAMHYFEIARRFRENGSLLFNLALACHNAGEEAKALAAADQSLAIEDSAATRFLKGSILEKLGRVAEAATELRVACRLSPDNESYWRSLGVLLAQHLAFDQAIEVFESAAARFPNSPQVLLGLGVAQYLRGTDEKAILALMQAVDLDPGLEVAAWLLGNVFPSAGDQSTAVLQRLERLARKHPSSFAANYQYGYSLLVSTNGDVSRPGFAKAESLLKKALALNPKSALACYQLGETHRLRGDLASAITMIERAVAEDPNYPDAHYKLARLYAQSGREADARKELELHEKALKVVGDRLERRFQETQQLVFKPK